ncbi:MAG: hydroxymethylbilane synthase [Bacteroidota bacterium]
MRPIKLGTRASKLALWQAIEVKKMLEKVGLAVEIVKIETKGDKILDRALSKIGSKGVFTEELETKLLSGEIDIVQHSAKDLQASLPKGLEIIAITKREKANDVVISFDENFKLKNAKNHIVATSSTRRVATLKHYYSNIQTTDIRGNLQTRFKKLEEGIADAMILAYAGVHRMGYEKYIVEVLDLEMFTPAVGQGSIAIECAESLDITTKNLIRSACNHLESEICISTERAFLKTLQGGCSIPVFGYATVDNTSEINITGGIISLNGSQQISHIIVGTNPDSLGNELGKYILENGGQEILDEIKRNL